MKELRTVRGRSLFFNVIFVVSNLLGLSFVLLSQLPQFFGYSIIFLSFGLFFLLASLAGIVIFRGRLLFTNVSRLIAGTLFIISGLVKANDPVGFSYKLEEYLHDGSIAYRLKEWMSSPSFSLESWIPWTVWISVFICAIEIIIGVLLLIGGKVRFTAWVALIMMLFFTFLTWHTFSCNPESWYTDQDTYKLPSREGYAKLKESVVSNRFFEVEKTSDHVILNEQKHPHCVSDCGCFGDALVGSIGRSLSPQESFYKDLFLVYLLFWIFISQGIVKPNRARQNVQFLLWSLGFTAFFCILFNWYFPLLFLLLVVVSALWMLRAGGVFFSNYWGSMFAVAIITGLFICYVFYFDPVKDFRPYAVGKNLNIEMNNGKPGVYENVFILKNKADGNELRVAEKEYTHRKDLWNERMYEFVRMDQRIISPGRLPSISEQFDPSRKVKYLQATEKDITYVRNQLRRDAHIQEVSLRRFIVSTDKIVLINAPYLEYCDWRGIARWKSLKNYFDRKKIPVVLLTASSEKVIRIFKDTHDFNVAIFNNDATELKTISRANPSLLYLEKGIVRGKFTRIQTPSVERFKKEFGY